LSKSFGEVHALKSIDLRVLQKSIFAFLGPNGTGKTTTIKLLLGLLKPTSGAEKYLASIDGSPLGLGLSWFIGEDDFGGFYQHTGGGATIETTMRIYPDLDLGVVVMVSVNGYGSERIVDALVSAWMHEK
jgi:ABC-type multidrug transport system ATPase subunit